MKILVSFFSVFLLVFVTHAQINLDSLWNIWQDETQSVTARLNALDEFAWEGYLFSQPDSAFYFAQMQFEFAESKGLKTQMARALGMQGVSFALRSDVPMALDYYQRCLKMYEELGDKNGMSRIMGNIGRIYKDLGDYPKALEYFQRSLMISEETGDQRGIANSLGNIGLMYNRMGDSLRALVYFQKCLNIHEEIGDKVGEAGSLSGIGNIHLSQGDYPKALEYFQRSLKIFEETGDKKGIAVSLGNSGRTYYEQGSYPKALEYYQRSLKIFEELEDKLGLAVSLTDIGSIYQKQGDHQKAIVECSKGLSLARGIGAIAPQKEACECLYDAYKASGNGNKALEYHEQMLVLDDSLRAEETTKKLEQMEFQKQMLADSLQKEEEKLKVQLAHEEEIRKEGRLRNIAIAAGIILLILAIGLYSRVLYIRKSKAAIEKEKDRSDNLLLNILPAEIAEELKEKGYADARDFDMVSILFSDFKGFTEASTKLNAQDLIREINTCFEVFDGIMGKYRVEKIKTIGDAYMAAGGLPVPTDDSVKNTVLAALEMQAFITKRKMELDTVGKTAFEMRVGVHTGPVVAGIVGVKKFQYDIWGDTVNTASRMESNSEVGQVNVSQATYDLLNDDVDFTFEKRGKIEAKGKGEIEMYFVSKA